jgi:hypothetical protein
MSTQPLESVSAPLAAGEVVHNRPWIGWSSLFFALLQSICASIVAINGLRLAIGIGAFALSTGAGAAMVAFHADAIRVPMIVIAVIGAVLNLAILMHVRYLRQRPASQWRQKPVTLQQKRTELTQLILSVATLALVVLEEYLHLHFHHSL